MDEGWDKEVLWRETKKYFEKDNIAIPMVGSRESVFRGKFIAFDVYVRKEDRSNIDRLI